MDRLKRFSAVALILAILAVMSACGSAASDTADKTGIIGATDEEVASLLNLRRLPPQGARQSCGI